MKNPLNSKTISTFLCDLLKKTLLKYFKSMLSVDETCWMKKKNGIEKNVKLLVDGKYRMKLDIE
jgi:hypothetical protein